MGQAGSNYPHGGGRRRATHSLRNRFKPDPRPSKERGAGKGVGHTDNRRDREYFCTCGHVYGNVPTRDAERMHRDHKRQQEDQ